MASLRMIRCFFILLISVVPIHTLAAAEDSNPQELRVLTFNIHAGKGLDGKLDLRRIAEVINNVKPDLVALQEVDVKTRRSGKVDQAQTLAKLCNMKSVFGKAMNYQGGQYGNALLAKNAIITSNVIEVSNTDTGAEPRSAVGIAVKLKNKQVVTLISTHWDHRSEKARSQAAGKLAKIVQRSKGVVLIAGDLNCELGSKEMTELDKVVVAPHQEPVNTFPVDNPTRQIDFLLIDRKANWKIKSIKAIDPNGASDHRPLLAVFELQ